MGHESPYYTVRGYRRQQAGTGRPTEAMEDYLEMLCRCSAPGEAVRVRTLARHLNVKPPSASKMVAQLREQGLVEAEHYGAVTVTPPGRQMGEYLLHRHSVLLRFFEALDLDGALEQVELIEHYLTPQTIGRLEALLPRLEGGRDAKQDG